MGSILCEHRPSPMKLEVMGVYDWPIWKRDPGSFILKCRERETRYFLRGRVIVTPSGSKPQEFGRGDLVTFPAGTYTWKVLKAVETHFSTE